MKRYRKKPIIVEAIQIKAEWFKNGGRPCIADCRIITNKEDKTIGIRTLEGLMTAPIGDWIIKGIEGELYSCKKNIFEKTYEAVKKE